MVPPRKPSEEEGEGEYEGWWQPTATATYTEVTLSRTPRHTHVDRVLSRYFFAIGFLRGPRPTPIS